ncbi:hypothetical protein RUM43_012102 [Polyplax serrata]|uniref:Uncharacterized protein n=1 Tax=Polyplax serrata TaxID=468196 RepID=A0AAN8PJA8_POLSC
MSSFDVKFFSASIADDEDIEEEKVDGDDSFNEQNDDWLRNDLGQCHRGEDPRSNYGPGQQQGMTLSSLPTSSFNIHDHDNTYADRISTLRSLHGGDSDLRRQQYRHGPDRVLVCELERHSHGSRAATLQLPRRRRDHYGDEVLRKVSDPHVPLNLSRTQVPYYQDHSPFYLKGDGEDPVYEEIRQAASDASDEELRRCVASRQSLRSCGDYSPLIPSSQGPSDPSRVHGSHVQVVSDPHGFLYSPRSHVLPIDR